ncbi:MAG: flagellar assembly protein FliW [Myxococcales bacterium]|nr:flagellar assembly protein FliW [Myxococcales bacterium]
MKLDTRPLGTVEVDPTRVVTFPEGLPGFTSKRFALVAAPDAPRVEWLCSLEDPELALLVVDPAVLDLDYAPRLKPNEAAVVQPGGDGDRLEYRLVASADEAGGVQLNMFAPILINMAAGLAMQLPLVGSGHTTHAPWPPKEEEHAP